MPPQTLVVDNGSYTIKAGFASENATLDDCRLIPNCLARSRDRRVLVASQLETCRDFGGMMFRRPVEKGYLVNWEAEKEIWDLTFLDKESPLACQPQSTNLLLTEAPNAPVSLQNNTDQMVFEEYEFSSYLRCVAPSLIPWNHIPSLFDPSTTPTPSPPHPAEAVLVIDTGFSHTHIVPTFSGQPYNTAIRRLDIGGKFLTNYLKELVSMRTWNMMDETHIMNMVKETTCFVSANFSQDLERCKRLSPSDNPIVRDYVLPDYNTGKLGFAREHVARKSGPAGGDGDDEQVMVLSNERFCVPELLFNPSDIGVKQAGLAEGVMQSLDMVPDQLKPALLANIVIVGGNANIPGLKERFEADLRPMAPTEAVVRVAVPEDPVKAAWTGGVRYTGSADFRRRLVTRAEYMEHGLHWAQRKMAGEDPIGGGELKETSAERDRRENRSHKKRRMD